MKFKSHLSESGFHADPAATKENPRDLRIEGKGIFNWPPNKGSYNLQQKSFFITVKFVSDSGTIFLKAFW